MGRFKLLGEGFQKGLGQGLGMLLVLSTALWAQSLTWTTFQQNGIISSSQINDNFSILRNDIDSLRTDTDAQTVIPKPPVGSIVAWHRDITGSALTLPDGWLECNGQTVSDADSPLDTFAVPNLNGGGRFLRGGASSGANQSDAFQGHWHNWRAQSNGAESATVWIGRQSMGDASVHSYVSGPPHVHFGFNTHIGTPSTGAHGVPRIDTETRPINMSVVWIIRVK